MKQGDDLWVVMGKTSEWTDEDDPDTPAPGDATIVEPIVAIKPIINTMAVEVTESAYNALQEGFRAAVSIEGVVKYLELVADEDAYDRYARYLYIKALYDPIIAGHPAFTSFRVYYLTSGLVPSAGYEDADWLVPDNIDDYGLNEYENAGTKILDGVAIVLSVVLEFR
jgi:hypothetical protein